MSAKWKAKVIDPLQEYNAESHRITIESIQRAMVELLQRNDFKSISIKELVERAGVSRSAFYRNYQSKEEVLQSIIHDAFAETAQRIKTMPDLGSRIGWVKLIEQLALQCADMYSIMSSDAWQGDTMLQCMNEYMTDMLPEMGMRDELQPRFWMGGIYNSIQYWLDTGRKEFPKELAERIMDCIWR